MEAITVQDSQSTEQNMPPTDPNDAMSEAPTQEIGPKESRPDVCPRPMTETPRNDVSSPTDGVLAESTMETPQEED